MKLLIDIIVLIKKNQKKEQREFNVRINFIPSNKTADWLKS